MEGMDDREQFEKDLDMTTTARMKDVETAQREMLERVEETKSCIAYFILHGKASFLCRLGMGRCALRRNQQAAEQVFHAPASFPPHLVSTTDSPLAMPPQSLPAVSANSADEAQMWSAPSIINSPGLAKRR